MNNLTFDKIISDTSHYGIIWKGKYSGKSCVIKMVGLTSGIHYNKPENCYYNGKKSIKTSKAEKILAQNDSEPFYHSYYLKRKAMTREKFNHEAKMIKKLQKYNLAPTLFKVFINDSDYPIHYGFIVMEYLPVNLKSLVMKRDYTSNEFKLIQETIKRLHKRAFCHGDMKPSNMGAYMNKKGELEKIVFLDLAKVRKTNHEKDFERDRKTFITHMKDNKKEAR